DREGCFVRIDAPARAEENGCRRRDRESPARKRAEAKRDRAGTASRRRRLAARRARGGDGKIPAGTGGRSVRWRREVEGRISLSGQRLTPRAGCTLGRKLPSASALGSPGRAEEPVPSGTAEISAGFCRPSGTPVEGWLGISALKRWASFGGWPRRAARACVV